VNDLGIYLLLVRLREDPIGARIYDRQLNATHDKFK